MVLAGSREHYEAEVLPKLREAFSYRSIMQVPRLRKICLNMGLGEAKNNKNILTENVKTLSLIAGQKALATVAKTSIAGFKIREEMPIGACVTLRKDRMYAFFTRFIHLSLPRVKDFHGLFKRAFDGRGNYSFGMKDCSVFVEVQHLHLSHPWGLSVQFVTSGQTNEEAYKLLSFMGMPFSD